MKSEDPAFPQTRWSLIQRVQLGAEDEAREAFETVCKCYWYPIYAYLRYSGHAPPDAEDLTQGFFFRLISEGALTTVRKERGRLRSYLLGVLKRHLSNELRHKRAQKRGGGQEMLSIYTDAAEDRYVKELVDVESPDRMLDRTWAVALLTRATERLSEAFIEGGNEEAFSHLKEFLPLGANATAGSDIARRMNVSESVVRLQIHRMRKRYARLVEEEVALTVSDPSDVQEELDFLMAAIGRRRTKL